MEKTIFRIGLLGVLVVSFGCTRAKETTKIRIVLPAAGVSASAVSGVTAAGSTGDSDSPWYGSSSLATDINCYFVTMGGPEPALSGNTCSDSTTNQVVLSFGPIVGGAKPGETIEISAPAGNSRVITVMGAKAEAGYCYNFLAGNGPPKGFLTHPRILASVKADLTQASNTVNIKVPSSGSIESNTEIGDCKIQAMAGGDGPVNSAMFFGDGRDGELTIAAGSSFDFSSVALTNGSFSSANAAPDLAAGKYLSTHNMVYQLSPDAKTITLPGGFDPQHFQSGDEVMWHVVAAWESGGPDYACGGGLFRGSYGFARLTATTSTTMTLNQPISRDVGGLRFLNINRQNYDSNIDPFCAIQVIRVPSFEKLTVNTNTGFVVGPNTSTAAGLSGGLLVFRTKQLILNYDLTLDSTGRGFAGAPSSIKPGVGSEGYSSSSGALSNGSGGGKSGSDAGGGSHVGRGGFAAASGYPMNFCSSGACYFLQDQKIFLGGGGGSAASSGAGAAGGGAVVLFAKEITGPGNLNILANGNSAGMPASPGGAGGGAGGSIHISASKINSSVILNAKGGTGASYPTGLGGGGGGGAIEVRYCASQSTDQPAAYVDPGQDSDALTSAVAGLSSIQNLSNFCSLQ